MNVREAILRTAELFEREPSLFAYSSIYVPECDTPGCAIGRIECFYGIASGNVINNGVLGVDSDEFYDRMDELSNTGRWRSDAKECASALRAYADRYHPEDKPALGSWSALKDIWQPSSSNA